MKKIIILIPVYNDWQSLEKLIENINLKVKNINCKFSIFLINDVLSSYSLLTVPPHVNCNLYYSTNYERVKLLLDYMKYK